MLDQNTDRMWFVIGAVIVGAAIIFIANGTLPTLFASVTDSFEEASNSATDTIADIAIASENRTHFEGYTYYFPEESGTWLHTAASKIITDYDQIALGFPRNVSSDAKARVEIEKVFSKPNTQFEVSFNAHRGGWSDIRYDLYQGDTKIGSFVAAQTQQTHTFTITSPAQLTKESNRLAIRSSYSIGTNAFWMSQLKVVEK